MAAIAGVIYCGARGLEHYLKNIEKTLEDLTNIVRDPPNYDYTNIFYEEPIHFNYPFDKINRFLYSLYQVNLSLTNLNLYLKGLLKSQERYLGAYTDGNKEYMKLQAAAYDSNLKMFIKYLYNFTDSSQFLKNISINDIIENENYTLDETYEYLNQLETIMKELGGFPQEVVENLTEQGYSDSEIYEIEQNLLNISGELASWDIKLTNVSSQFNQSLTLFSEQIYTIVANLTYFVEEMGVVANNFPIINEFDTYCSDDRKIGNLIIDPMYQLTKPINLAQFNIKIENEQDIADTFILEFDGFDPNWHISLQSNEITVPAHSARKITLTIGLPGNIEAKPNRYELTCTLYSTNVPDPSKFKITTNFYIKILKVYEYQLLEGISYNKIDPWLFPIVKNRFSFLLENTGNVADEYKLNLLFEKIEPQYSHLQKLLIESKLCDIFCN